MKKKTKYFHQIKQNLVKSGGVEGVDVRIIIFQTKIKLRFFNSRGNEIGLRITHYL